jgi:zinc/manganese transport system substrate-binding protein
VGLARTAAAALWASVVCAGATAACATQPPINAAPVTAKTGNPSADQADTPSSDPSTTAAPRLRVVAAENSWASIAGQLGGDRVDVSSIITNPSTDPHDYEATPADARSIATAQLFIQNGIGYDSSWAPKLVAANPAAGRQVLTVGDIVGLADGANPHQWYSRESVSKVIEAITAAFAKVDPADAAWFDAQRENFESTTLVRYDELEGRIKDKYAGTPIGGSESVVSPLADSLGLRLITPASFLTAVSEGTDPSVADKTLIDQQIKNHQIKVYVYNTQNSTPDVSAEVAEAKAAGIPVTPVTETLSPADTTFQDWMVTELAALEAALAEGTGK